MPASALVWTAHDLFRHDRREDPNELAFMRSLFELADAVIVHCEAAADEPARDAGRGSAEAAPRSPSSRTVTTRAPTPTPSRAPRHATSSGLPDGRQGHRLRGLGALATRACGSCPEAFRHLEEPEARLVIAGDAVDGAYAARLTAAAKGDERIHLALGFVPDEDLQLYLRAADVVAAPFLEIFTSGSVLLAMSFERAVIAPRRGCVDRRARREAAASSTTPTTRRASRARCGSR